MEYEVLLTIQGYGKFFITLFVFIIFYGYVYSIYHRERTGKRNFEKYSKLALDDSLDSVPLEKKR